MHCWQIGFVLITFVLTLRPFTVLTVDFPILEEEIEPSYWLNKSMDQLKEALSLKNGIPGSMFGGEMDLTYFFRNGPLKAKNAIFFLGDGMGMTTVTAIRYAKAQLTGKWAGEETLVWEKWPFSSNIKTFDLERLTTDSAASATAYLTGKSFKPSSLLMC